MNITSQTLQVRTLTHGRDLRVTQCGNDLVVFDNAAPQENVVVVTIPRDWDSNWAWNVAPDSSDEELVVLIAIA